PYSSPAMTPLSFTAPTCRSTVASWRADGLASRERRQESLGPLQLREARQGERHQGLDGLGEPQHVDLCARVFRQALDLALVEGYRRVVIVWRAALDLVERDVGDGLACQVDDQPDSAHVQLRDWRERPWFDAVRQRRADVVRPVSGFGERGL